jgi:hypothetical protein
MNRRIVRNGTGAVSEASFQPVLECQARHFDKVARVTSKKSRAVGQDNAGDFQIHSADAHAVLAGPHKQVGSRCIPREHRPGREEINAPPQPIISRNLAVRIVEAMDFGQPTTELLLDRNDCCRRVLPGRPDAVEQLQAVLGGEAQYRDMVCVKYQQSLSRKFAASDTRGRAFRLLLLSRHLALNQQCGANPSWAPATQEPARSTQRFSSPVLPLVFQASATWQEHRAPCCAIPVRNLDPTGLFPEKVNNQLVLSWTNAGFSLPSAPAVTGTFTNISGATSPYTNSLTGAQQFFRLKGD